MGRGVSLPSRQHLARQGRGVDWFELLHAPLLKQNKHFGSKALFSTAVNKLHVHCCICISSANLFMSFFFFLSKRGRDLIDETFNSYMLKGATVPSTDCLFSGLMNLFFVWFKLYLRAAYRVISEDMFSL